MWLETLWVLPAIWVLVAVTLGRQPVRDCPGCWCLSRLFRMVYTLLKENVNQRLSEKNIKIDLKKVLSRGAFFFVKIAYLKF